MFNRLSVGPPEDSLSAFEVMIIYPCISTAASGAEQGATRACELYKEVTLRCCCCCEAISAQCFYLVTVVRWQVTLFNHTHNLYVSTVTYSVMKKPSPPYRTLRLYCITLLNTALSARLNPSVLFFAAPAQQTSTNTLFLNIFTAQTSVIKFKILQPQGELVFFFNQKSAQVLWCQLITANTQHFSWKAQN